MISQTNSVSLAIDDRSYFPVISFAWRARTSNESEVRNDLALAFSQTDNLAPVWHEWSGENGATILTLALEPTQIGSWMETTARKVLNFNASIGSGPFISYVGNGPDGELVQSMASDVLRTNRHAPNELTSRMQQTMTQGFQQTVITGKDPAVGNRAAATFLALCVLNAGDNAVLPKIIRETGTPATLQISRGLIEEQPAVIWQSIRQGTGGLQFLNAAVQTFRSQKSLLSDSKLDQAKSFALANLSRPWRSPSELARTINQYQVMGWGEEIILDPRSSLDLVDQDDVLQAIDLLFQPIQEVLGID